MAPLRSPLRRVFPSHKSLARPPRKWLGLRLEQLEDRILMAQNAIAVPFVDGLYQVLLDRVPGPGEAAGWIDGLENGTSTPGRVALGFLHSPEFNLRVVQDQYTELLGRAAEPGVIAGWTLAMQAAGSCAPLTVGILSAPEYFAAWRETAEQVAFLAT